MPLDNKCSQEAFDRNVKISVDEGRPRDQAVAIAFSTLRRACGVPKDAPKKMKVPDILAYGSKKKEAGILFSGRGAVQAEEKEPRSGWERGALDMFKSLREAADDMRSAARHKAYMHVLGVVVPSILNDISELVVRMYPHETSYERWMLLTAAENLADIVAEVDEDRQKEEPGSIEKIRSVLRAACEVSGKKKGSSPVTESGLQPKRGWTKKVRDFIGSLRKVSVDLRRDAQGGDYVHLLKKVFPAVLVQMSTVLDVMFPGVTERQKKMLVRVADELVELSSGVMVTDDLGPEVEESVDTDGEEQEP